MKTLYRYRFQCGILSLLVGLLGLFIHLSPQTFLHSRIYIAFMSTIPFAALLALGLTLLIVAGELDLSFPAIMAVSGFCFSSISQATASPVLGLFGALATGSLAGLCNGLIVVKIGVPAIIATIGTQFFWRGTATLLADGLAVNLTELRETALHHILVGRLFDCLPMQSLWCLVIALFFWMILNRHIWGDDIRFIGDDITTATMMGVKTDNVRIGLFITMGLMSALASVMVCLEMASWWPTQGEGYLLIVFAAIFLGGTSVFGGQGTIFGTITGSIIIGILEAGIISGGLSGYWTRLAHGLVIVVSVSVYAVALKTRRT
ncbi:ABC transporter permease [Desulforhopalus singaporensis]|uniref:Monosaccharide ABC transporter membrane protein, CUT2 family n=1 Tax=Desulforhopalus singaporensis TaxID=91360 RepID=A0A1H0R3B1_9BACT|nr:ABC transporter permease [Desulforhopalus singaporensis]SDP23556.1 monosaccharide ABC transporter membrane protein, CUT2 family [Desulforhopalus singaporensis]